MPPKTIKKKSLAKRKSPRRVRSAIASPQSRAVLSAEEELFAKAFRSSPHPIGITELETGRCLEINDACLEIFGFRRDEVVGHTTLMLGIWPDPQARVRLIDRLRSEGTVRNLEVSMRMKDGELRQFIISTDLITLGGKPCLLTIGNDITERKKAEDAWRESEQRFRAIYDQTYEFIGLLTPDGTLIDVNQTALAFRGLRRSDVVGKPFWETPWWDLSRKLQEELKAAIAQAATGEFVRLQAQHRAQDGTIEEIDFSVTPITDQTGKVTQIIPEGRRITPLTRAQDQLRQAQAELERLVQERTAEYDKAIESLRESEERLQGTLDHSPNLVFMKDLQGRYVDVNKQFERTFHLTRDDVIGKTDYDIFPSEYATAYHANDLQVSKAGRSLQFEEVALHDDGLHTNIVWKFPLRRLDGTPYALCGVVTDITERKLAEIALGEREHEFRLLADNIPAYFSYVDTELRYRFVNKRYQELFGRHQAELCGQLVKDVVGEANFSAIEPHLREAFAGRQASFLYPMVLPNGDCRWMNVHYMPDRVETGRIRGVLALETDVTDQKQSELALQQNQLVIEEKRQELQMLTDKLFTAQDSERQRIARDLHDDFSQRLAALVLDVTALQQQPPLLPELIKKALKPVREELQQLCHDLHDLAYRLHSPLLRHLGLQAAIEDHIAKAIERTGLRISLEAKNVPSSIPLESSLCLFRVFQESLQNVAKHAKATEVSVMLSGSSKGIGLSVIDNGKGFDANDKSGHQKGLGLISMQERLRLLNGFLNIHSRPADGTKVCAWIPFQEKIP